jgi:hypothetical protein
MPTTVEMFQKSPPVAARDVARAGSVCLAAGLAVFLMLAAAPARAASCSVGVGWRVVLASDAVDPDVFLWDSRGRLVEYAAGQWGDTQAIFAHTMLVQPGTQAVVIACAAGAAHPKYSSTDLDLIGVKVLTGPFRGRYGWVLSNDAHPMRDVRSSRN